MVANVVAFFATMISTVVAAVGGFIGAVIGFFGSLLAGVVAAVTSLVTSVINFFTNLIRTVSTAINNFVRDVVNFFIQLGRDIIAELTKLPARMVQIGRDIIDGIVRGLKAAAGAVTDFLVGLAQDALGAVKRFLGIASPSKVFRDQVGAQMGAGIAEGLRLSTGDVIAQARRLTDAATAAAATSVPVGVDAAVQRASALTFGDTGPTPAEAQMNGLLRELLDAQAEPAQVRVFIGETELTDLIKTEIDTNSRTVARTVRAGAGVTR
jgi:phage-related protein